MTHTHSRNLILLHIYIYIYIYISYYKRYLQLFKGIVRWILALTMRELCYTLLVLLL